MAKYKLLNDYTFRGKGNKIYRNKLEGNRIVDQVIIDGDVENVTGWLHLFEIVNEKPETKKDEHKDGSAKQVPGNTGSAQSNASAQPSTPEALASAKPILGKFTKPKE
jgi:hypothetical protein